MANKELIKKLKELLKELFQFENNDLDFGVYRIINIKKDEIEEFIEHEVEEIIKNAIKTVGNNTELKNELQALQKDIEDSFGCAIEEAKKKYIETPKVKDYFEKEKELKLADQENNIEEEIYDDIINFFSRYYDKGDFISKRRYSRDAKYAIPYNGEEVYLYWANNDQYYIKTGENFKNYSFTAGSTKVDFEIIAEEVDVEKGNIKDAEKKLFIFSDFKYVDKARSLIVKFGYRGLTQDEEKAIAKLSTKKTIGKDEVNLYNLEQINEKIGIYGLSDLQKAHINMNGEKAKKNKGKEDIPELEWHLNKYTTKNTSDYFIHKNLKKFLSQEINFFIKNELLHIDNIGSKDDFKVNLNKIKVFKEISSKIIDFLAQVEEFQKKLWEKKKFVIATDYCMTLDYIDEKYYPEILKNKEQIQKWISLGFIEKNTDVTKKFLSDNPTLTLDTKFYDVDFKYQLLSEIDDLDEKITGILINSDNFHALNLLLNKYKEKVKCCYIDPPYNTEKDRNQGKFIYKDGFSSSSWLTLMNDRLAILKLLLNEKSSIFVSLDDNEIAEFKLQLNQIFTSENFLGNIVLQTATDNNPGQIKTQHEYILSYAVNKKSQEHWMGRSLAAEKILLKYNELKKELKDNVSDIQTKLRIWIKENEKELPSVTHYNYVDKNGVFYPDNPANTKMGGYVFEVIHPETKKICKNPTKGFRFPQETFRKMNEEGNIYYGSDENTIPRPKKRLENVKDLLRSIIYEDGRSSTNRLQSMFNGDVFDNPKSETVLSRLIGFVTNTNEMIVDFFGGSGTTGHAIINLNKEDQGKRKFILVELSHYFETVTKPRLLKVIYSNNWKEGKPLDNNGSKKQIIKYQSLEQYEDSLNNIDFKEALTLAKESRDYKIKYMLEFEAKDNNVFLNLDALDNPFEYKLKVESNNEFKETSVDLVETFNYIAGIKVKSIKRFHDDKITYIIIKGLRSDNDVIVIWRNKTDGFDPKKDKEFVNKEILKEEYDEILVNGNSLIEGAKSIDEVFKANMFGR